MPESTFHFLHFTEREVAEYLVESGVNSLTTKAEKLALANRKVGELLPLLWLEVKRLKAGWPNTDDKELARRIEQLARRLETLSGLGAVITLAGVAGVSR